MGEGEGGGERIGEGKASCRIVFPVYFHNKETQYQRHEVCLKSRGLECWSIGVLEYWGIKLSEGEGSRDAN